jgi:EAL domain-containing protein (putative c-di-GMP-specific phosphodiesterase class I)/GGDEF domain-containing protein
VTSPDSKDSSAPSSKEQEPPITLPTLAEGIEMIRAAVQGRGELLVIYLNFDRYAKIEEIYGWEKLDAVLDTTAMELQRILAGTVLHSAVLTTNFEYDDDFILLHVPAPDEKLDDDVSEALVRLIRDNILAKLEETYGQDIASLFDLYIGRSVIHYDPRGRLNRQVYRCIREAAGNARNVEQRERVRLINDLRETLQKRAVYIEYHPIVSTTDGTVFGYEALARGLIRSLRRPEVMFDVAAEAGLIWELSRLCRDQAIAGMQTTLKDDQLLFLNVDPHDFSDPTFDEATLNIPDPRRVVIEITERTAIKDYPRFRERLRMFRNHGYRFAVDDAGSGYAGLGSIANLEPDFIKLDLSLITGIDTNFIKQDLVGTMVRFANDQGAKVIAEGVERQGEYEMVKSLGVHFVQGFFLHNSEKLPNYLEGSLSRPQFA